jgi:hypothetical protein
LPALIFEHAAGWLANDDGTMRRTSKWRIAQHRLFLMAAVRCMGGGDAVAIAATARPLRRRSSGTDARATGNREETDLHRSIVSKPPCRDAIWRRRLLLLLTISPRVIQ